MTARTLHRSSVVLLVACTLSAALAPFANGAEPQPSEWSPFIAPEPITALALAREGTTLAAGNAAVTGRSDDVDGIGSGQVTPPGATDFRAFDLREGILFNSSESPQGVHATAVSGDGSLVIVAGRRLNSDYITQYRIPEGGGAPATRTITLESGHSVTSLSATGDGRRVAAAFDTPTGGRVVVYNDNLQPVLTFDGASSATSIALSKEGEFVVAGGRHRVDNVDMGAVYLFRYPSAEPLKRTVLSAANATEVRAVRITPDGSSYAALTTGGQVLAFRNEGAATKAPFTFGESQSNVTARALAISDDGRFIAFGADRTLRLLEFSGTSLTETWAHPTSGDVTSVAVDRTADVVVVGVAGGQGGALAFSPRSADPYWRLTGGGVSHVAVDADGEWVAYAQGNRVYARELVHRFAVLFEERPGVGVPTPPPARTQPFQAFEWSILVANEGASPERLELEVPSISGITFTADPARLTLDPGQTSRVVLSATPGRVPPGNYSANLTARSDAHDVVSNLTVNLTVEGLSELDVTLNGASERSIVPGGDDSIRMNVVNNGNNPSDVSVAVAQRVSAGPEWQVRLVGDNRFSLAPGGQSSIRVLVEVPHDAVNGSTNRITVTVSTESGVSRSEVLYSVNPFVAVNVTGPGEQHIIPKFVHAGRTVQFNLTVTNTGSVPSQFEAIYYEPRITGNRQNWVVDLDLTPFPLEPGQNRTLPVRVFAPKDATNLDRLSVVVEVQSVAPASGMKIARENVTLIANVADAPPSFEDTNDRIPGPGALLAVLATVASALLATRRRPQ